MTVKERILAIRLLNQAEKQPAFAGRLGVEPAAAADEGYGIQKREAENSQNGGSKKNE